ncbi:MAG: hypothetical protein HY519_00375 [Candidatus Aenigmarchaeota archaeon]|nr:hypothetical protein [Candidatus Aenigmarchaeota archaeon]
MMETDLLKLVKTPSADGIGQYYLYPEYAGNLGRYSGGESRPLAGKTSRKTCVIYPSDGSGPYVAKKERQMDEHRAEAETKFPEQFPQGGNMSLRDISITRALSKLAQYEDDKIRIAVEKPLGYFEDNEGQRTAFYEFQPGLDNKPQKPEALKTLLESVQKGWKDEVDFLNSDFLEKVEHLTGHALTYNARMGDPMWSLYKNHLLRLGETKRSVEARKQVAEDAHFPYLFAKMVMLANGVAHNEMADEYAHLLTPDGKLTTFITDFELSVIQIQEHVEYLLDLQLWYLASGVGDFTDFNNMRSLQATERRSGFLNNVGDTSPELARRIENFLRPTGYFDGKMERFGPAYEILNALSSMPAEEFLIK